MMATLKSIWKDEEGASAIEYALIAGLVAVVLIAVLADDGTFGSAFENMFDRLAGKLDEVAPGDE